MSYVDEVLARVKTKNAAEPEFLQAVDEVLESIRPVVEANEELYKKEAILERIQSRTDSSSSVWHGLMTMVRYR